MGLNQEQTTSSNINHQKGKVNNYHYFNCSILNFHSIFKEFKDDVNATLANNCTVYSVKPNGEIEECDLSKPVAVPLPKSDGFNRDMSQDENSRGMARLPYGIPVYCNNVPCIYEFRVFKYIGRHGNE